MWWMSCYLDGMADGRPRRMDDQNRKVDVQNQREVWRSRTMEDHVDPWEHLQSGNRDDERVVHGIANMEHRHDVVVVR